MTASRQLNLLLTRRHFFGRTATGIGAAALASLLNPTLFGAAAANNNSGLSTQHSGLPNFPNFLPKAKRVIYLFMSGGPSHIDLFDYKPALQKLHASEL